MIGNVLIAFILTFVFTTSYGQTRFKSLNYLYKIQGKQTIGGIHNREPNADPDRWTEWVKDETGQYPGLWSGDFLFQSENIANRWTMIYEAEKQWKKGALVNIMWHACNPSFGSPCGWDNKGVMSKLSDEQWKELTTDGTSLNKKWKTMMDDVAQYLQYLEDKGVEVLFRPLHEQNQGAFWWGGKKESYGTKKLWQLTHDYFTKTKGLSNLIWVWNIQDFDTMASDLDAFDPGEEYYDMLSMDMYQSDGKGYTQEKYDAIRKKAGNKPIAIGECSLLPSSDLLASQPLWTFFMGWSELVKKDNSLAAVKAVFRAENVITLNEMPDWKNTKSDQ